MTDPAQAATPGNPKVAFSVGVGRQRDGESGASTVERRMRFAMRPSAMGKTGSSDEAPVLAVESLYIGRQRGEFAANFSFEIKGLLVVA